MSHERFERIADLFLQASERPPQARREFLEGACGGDEAMRDEVDAMLLNDARPPSLARTGAMLALVDAEPPEPPPAWIGPYRIIREIGEGGMGIVYLAEQEHPIRRQVAVKLIRPEIRSRRFIARFEFERQALALMNHPNIARVFDAGETPERRPYLAMEHVTGEPITSYCDARRLGIEARLRLFLEVCAGVAHAHRNAVIHRDLKPSNILVSQDAGTPVPKIIDFGIAKALDQHDREQATATEIGQLLGTYEYMSPEQLSGGPQVVDTRTDVYSLGVVLYELLTGVRPFERDTGPDAGFVDLCRRIRDEEPERPSVRAMRAQAPGALPRRLRGDLDAIAIKALAKDPQARYAGPSAMAVDIERHLDNRPIHARSPGPLVRLRKAIKRHRGAAAVVAVLSVTLIGLAFLGTVQAVRARRESARAEAEVRIGSEVRKFILGVIDPPRALVTREWSGAVLTSKDHDALLDRIRERFANQPLLQSQLLFAVGNHLIASSESAREIPTLVESRDRITALLGPDSTEALAANESLAHAYSHLMRFQEAEPLLLAALKQRRLADSDGLDTWRTTARLADLYKFWNRHDQAAPLFEDAIAGLERRLGPEHPDVLSTTVGLSGSYLELGRFKDTQVLLERAIDRIRRVFGERNYQTAVALYNLACAHANSGRTELALDYLRQSTELGWTYPHGPFHDPQLLPLHGDPRFDKLDRAARLNDRAVWAGRLNAGESAIREGRLDDAERLLVELIAAIKRVDGDGAAGWATRPRWALARCWIIQGRFDDAEGLLLPMLVASRAESRAFDEKGTLDLLAQCDIGRGRREFALARLALMETSLHPVWGNIEMFYTAAESQALRGRHEDALRSLAHASELGFDDVERLEHDLAFEKIRGRSEFRAVVKSARQRAL